jgi:hypothetical protein
MAPTCCIPQREGVLFLTGQKSRREKSELLQQALLIGSMMAETPN